jgi:hypothetical protein
MTGSVAMAGMTDPDHIWTEAAGRLRGEIGEGAFSSYIAPSAVRTDGKAGVVWHTQGSGKSLTMIWLAKWIREHITDSRVLVLDGLERLPWWNCPWAKAASWC